MNKFKTAYLDIIDSLNNIKYDNGDASDIGNEIGIVIAKYFSDEDFGWDKDGFLSGIKHGISLTDGTHFSIPDIEERKLTFEERCQIYLRNCGFYSLEGTIFVNHCTDEVKLIKLNEANIPTKVITKLVNGEIVKTYE